ncbi:rod shape-determining protein MreC [bacterium]|jgi:cell shape-determining protein MreC|nr:rod shape-determining protein MreC [bacterium]
MDKKLGSTLLFLSLILFLIFQIPFVKEIRLRSSVQKFFSSAQAGGDSTLELLSLENLLLKDELDAIRNQLNYDLKDWDAIQAKVIFRENISFGSFLWVDRGEADNKRLGATVIAKKSPVVLGKGVVGVIEEVLEKKSLVRLITDPKLQIAVRVDRGKKGIYLEERLYELKNLLEKEEEIFKNQEHKELTNDWIQVLLEKVRPLRGALLAKGVIQGVANPGWRVAYDTLSGYGFNYDFADSEGGPFDLRTEHLIRVGDLLVTTGLDGIFPRGLHVGVVTKIDPLKEGGYAYGLSATPSVHELQYLDNVQILPPQWG